MPVAFTGAVSLDERRIGHVNTHIIKRVHVALGDHVRRDHPLLDTESVTVGEGQSAHQEATAMLDLTRRNFQRASELHKENTSSKKEFLQARQELEAAQIRAQGARNRLSRPETNAILADSWPRRRPSSLRW